MNFVIRDLKAGKRLVKLLKSQGYSAWESHTSYSMEISTNASMATMHFLGVIPIKGGRR